MEAFNEVRTEIEVNSDLVDPGAVTGRFWRTFLFDSKAGSTTSQIQRQSVDSEEFYSKVEEKMWSKVLSGRDKEREREAR